MMSDEGDCRYDLNVRELQRALPTSLGFRKFKIGEGLFEIRTLNVVIRISFEPHDSESAVVELFDATSRFIDQGMSVWIMRQIRGAKSDDPKRVNSFRLTGEILASKFGDILHGDFSFRREYDFYKNRILNEILNVTALPLDHPTRIRYENCDLQWLTEMEDGTFRTLHNSH